VSRSLILFACLAVVPLALAGGGAGRYVTTADYVTDAFPHGAPPASVVWLTGDLRGRVEEALEHPVSALRVRGWYDGATSAWILDEVGKERPITVGITIADGAVADVRILEFRESRGWEVRYPFFTDQFRLARLADDDHLDRRIDGITGATLSVAAVKRVVRVALLLHEQVASKP